MRWKQRSIHDKALIVLALVVVFLVIISACIIDTNGLFIPAFVIVITGMTYILAFVYANKTRWDKPNKKISDLKKCPFCGNEPRMYEMIYPGGQRRWRVICTNGCYINKCLGSEFMTAADARAAWNRRSVKGIADERQGKSMYEL